MPSAEDRRIQLRGVRVHNLKGIDLDLPIGRWTVLAGVSGSGKSSLAFDTLYAEGQRRYIETFSAYTRQFLERLDKPDADRIDGIPPAIAVGQRGQRRSARSTVGTVTDVHDALALLYARVGRVFCQGCGREVRPSDPESVVRAIEELPERARYQIAFPLEVRPESDRQALADALREDGFVRLRVDGTDHLLESGPLPEPVDGQVDVVVDRLVRGSEPVGRRLDSIETAFNKGLGRCRILSESGDLTFYKGWRCAGCGREQVAPDPRLFRYNGPLGACPSCEGFGRVIDLDLDRIVPDPNKTLAEGAIAPWTTPAYQEWNAKLLSVAPNLGIPTDRPFRHLSESERTVILEGSDGFSGLRGFFRWLERKTYKMHVRVFLSRWRSYRTCPDCQGKRLRPEALAVKVGGLDIAALSALPIGEALAFLRGVAGEPEMKAVRRRVLEGVLARLDYLERIGLDYLTLDRQARTLSGGESRRVTLATALGSGLVNTLYVLDEPSIGLHPRDVGRLVDAITRLRDSGNTVAVVEHEEAILRAADLMVEIGPGAGESGGRVVYVGPPEGSSAVPESITGTFLSGRRRPTIPRTRREPKGAITLLGASGHNLRDLDVTIPLGLICVVTGVSGAGKSTLVEKTLYPALLRRLKNQSSPGEPFREIRGTQALEDVVLVDQSPIGRTPRSNPVTYLNAFDEIRKAFAATHEAKLRNYGAGRFSFNVEGGRCETCEGNGYLVIEMQFLADVMTRCPECRGRRYRPEVLEITYRGKNIAEVLDLTAREAFTFFKHRPRVQARLRPLLDVGLDYLRLGQPANTLSGGEAQRLKLASRLASSPAAIQRSASGPSTLFILDEPTTGLHPADVSRLIDCLNALADLGHSLLLIEHNLPILASADWLLDLGPDAGDQGGRLVTEGTPETVAQSDGHTGRALAEFLART